MYILHPLRSILYPLPSTLYLPRPHRRANATPLAFLTRRALLLHCPLEIQDAAAVDLFGTQHQFRTARRIAIGHEVEALIFPLAEPRDKVTPSDLPRNEQAAIEFEDFEGLGAYLASDASSFVSGETITVDGGYMVRPM